MTERPLRVCLISMPFMPLLTPALGVSTLRAILDRAGIDCDVWYGSLALIDEFSAHVDPSDALLDYTLIATLEDLGDVFFAGALWPGRDLGVDEAFRGLVGAAQANVPEIDRAALGRLLDAAGRAESFIEQASQDRRWRDYDIIGFSSTFSQQVASLALARRIKAAHPDACILFGGANCEGDMGRQLLESFPWVDAVLRGEADHTLPVFVDRVRHSRDAAAQVPGAIVRTAAGLAEGPPAQPVTNLDALPLPDFDDYFEQLPTALRATDRALPIETSRGCWWGAKSHCTFCGLNPTGMAFRAKSPQRAVDEFATQSVRYGARRFEAVDNIIDMQFFRTVLPQLEPLQLTMFYETKANLQPWHVEQLARSGVSVIQPGIEGLHSDILSLMRKGVRGYQNLQLLKACRAFAVRPLWFYLYRFPHEPQEAYWRDVGLMPNLWHLPPPRNPNPVVIDRYSPLFTQREAFGLRNLRPSGRLAISYAGLNEEERSRIAYHFDADLPQGNELPYADALWFAISQWNRAFAAGAFLVQLSGDHTTLVVDGRDRGGPPSSYVLSGAAHAIWQAMSDAPLAEALAERARQRATVRDQLSARDVTLTMAAVTLGAAVIEPPDTTDDSSSLLAQLEDAGLAILMDGRWVTLAVELADPAMAATLGLAHLDVVVPTGVTDSVAATA